MSDRDVKTAICPVMKVETDKEKAEAQGLVREYNGKKYYLCCAPCGEMFDADPEKYTAGSNDAQSGSHDHGHHHHA